VQPNAEWKRFLRHHKALAAGAYATSGEKLPRKHCGQNLWLLKPSFLNQVGGNIIGVCTFYRGVWPCH